MTILVGGGLANCLIAWRIRQQDPARRLLVLERGPTLGGNHTWCFHRSDVSAAQLEWLEPLVAHAWDDYEIRFPDRRRRLGGGYYCITSEQLHRQVAGCLGDDAICGVEVTSVTPDGVTLADGRNFAAATVIDGRGAFDGRAFNVGFQKFVGRVVELDEPHGLHSPILMDATVEQIDGFRFMYTLPMGGTKLLIEDTRYSESATLDHEAMRNEIDGYAQASGWRIVRTEREEAGVLPVVMGGDIEAWWAAAPGVPRSGIRAGLFHYVTGYSLPSAVELADAIAMRPPASSAELYRRTRARSRALWREGAFYRLLNRMLFRAAKPAERYRVLQHFYRLPDDVVHRFYAGRTTLPDRVRILSGRPPVPVGRAIASWFSGADAAPAERRS